MPSFLVENKNENKIMGHGYMDVKEFNLRNKIEMYIEQMVEIWERRITKILFSLFCVVIIGIVFITVLV